MRLGLVGYGVGGRYFHAPFIAAAKGVELAGVVTRSPERRTELAADIRRCARSRAQTAKSAPCDPRQVPRLLLLPGQRG